MLPALIALRPPDQRLVVQECLHRLQLRPVVFQNAMPLQYQVEHNRIDLLIIDLDDPELLLHLLELKSTPLLGAIPVVGVSVQSGSAMVESFLTYVVDLFVAKPVQPDVLTNGISSLCGFGYRLKNRHWSSVAAAERGGVWAGPGIDRGMN